MPPMAPATRGKAGGAAGAATPATAGVAATAGVVERAAGATGAAALPATTALPGMAMRGGAGRIADLSLAAGRWTARELTAARAAAMSPMSTRPRYAAPASIITRGDARSPTTRAVDVSFTLSEATMAPTTVPETTSWRTSTSAWTVAPFSTVRFCVSWTLPSMRPRTIRSSSPRTSPEIRVSGPITVSLSAMVCALHVHIHVALEPGTVGNHDAR